MTSGLKIRNKEIQIYDKNPRTTNNNDPSVNVEKIIIKDLPLSLDNSEILKYLKTFEHVKYTTDLRYSRERNEQGELTSFRNGDRYLYAVSPVLPILPNIAFIAGMKCRISHATQCLVCRICGDMGHKARTEECPAYDTNVGVLAFRSHEHPLSNFYPCKIEYKEEEYASLEHAYQVTKAISLGDLEIAESIKNAPNAFFAKRISKQLDHSITSEWENSNIGIMEELVRIKSETVPEFRNALFESAGYMLAEATRNTYWASGLNPEMTEVTKPQYWPGKNVFGSILMKLRQELREQSQVAVDTSTVTTLGGSNTILENSPSGYSSSGDSPLYVSSCRQQTQQEHSPTPGGKYTVSITHQVKRRPSASPESDSKKVAKMNRPDENG